jgi:hypothetical protein
VLGRTQPQVSTSALCTTPAVVGRTAEVIEQDQWSVGSPACRCTPLAHNAIIREGVIRQLQGGASAAV